MGYWKKGKGVRPSLREGEPPPSPSGEAFIEEE